MKRRGFLESIPSFSLLLIMVVLMTIGAALVPRLRLSYKPTPKQSSQLTISCSWHGASAQVIEQEVISRLEGSVSTVVGIDEVTSRSEENKGSVTIRLKEGVNIAAKRFEISSLLKQVAQTLPDGASYPNLSGGSVATGEAASKHLLSYTINADRESDAITDYIKNVIQPQLKQIEGVSSIWVAGSPPSYLDIEYDPHELESYGLDARAIAVAIDNFLGRSSAVGDVDGVTTAGVKERISLLFRVDQGRDIGAVPLGVSGGRMVYLRDVARIESKVRSAERYFRINGMNTVNMNISVNSESNLISMSDKVQKRMQDLKATIDEDFHITMTHDSAKEIREELYKLIRRTFLSLLILFIFIYATSRSLRYLSILAVTLAANMLIATILYYMLDVQLHLFSLAGITVSFGIIIDTSIVMVDHYNYYRNRTVFIAILAALLTTIGSLMLIFFMPDFIKRDLMDFVIIIIINLTVSLFVSLLFVPAIIDRFGAGHVHEIRSNRRRTVRFSRLYGRYIAFTQHRKWIYITIVILAFGLPIHLLPSRAGEARRGVERTDDKRWYEELYNATIGSSFYQQTLREPLENSLGGAMRLFGTKLSGRTYSSYSRDVKLTITARLTEGNDGSGNGAILNEKMREMESFLASFDKIRRYETSIDGASGNIVVQFNKEVQRGSFPVMLESEVISKALGIGGVEWSTSGVSDRGFSNSLGLGRKSYSIELTGYNYQALRDHAEHIAERIAENSHAMDVSIEDGQYSWNSRVAKGLALDYDMERVTMYDVDLKRTHNALAELLNYESLGTYRDSGRSYAIDYHSAERDKFDLWSLFNRYITVDGREIRFSHIGTIGERNARQVIAKRNQEYTISIAYNYLGSYTLADRFTTEIIEEANDELPIGFRAQNRSYGWYEDRGTQYWLILVIVIIIFFVSSILFESLRLPFVIISLIPISFIGTFMTYYFAKINFGTGGFAALVLLSGLVVNSAIYLVNEYNTQLSERRQQGVSSNLVRLYVRSFNHKITPIMLTILSTVLGLVPFLLDGGSSDDFWLSFAVGSISGLLFSILALIFVMPILMNLRPKC